MNKLLLIALAASLTAILPTPVANAEHCGNETYLFSAVRAAGQGTPSLAYNGVACDTLGLDDENADARIINPGANAIKLRYLQTSASCDGTATLNGYGFSNTVVPFALVTTTTGTFCDTAWQSIDSGATGTLTADISMDGGSFTETIQYRRG